MGGTAGPCQDETEMDGDVSVLIVDDQAPFRAAARAVLAMTPGFGVVGEAGNGEEAVELTDALQPQLVLMDINMPVVDGIEATRRIVAGHPSTVVILLSTYDIEDVGGDVNGCGAVAYVNKEDFGPGTLRDLWAAHGGL
jgi:DNA-binding NarL/FixJ family response regulator